MPKFSMNSQIALSTCHMDLQKLFMEVIKRYDCTIICGHRSEAAQNTAFAEGKSKLKYPSSKHNSYPSMAVDVAPYVNGIHWNDLGGFYLFAGYVMRVADELGISIRYGGDWDGDKTTADQKFHDLPHFELKI